MFPQVPSPPSRSKPNKTTSAQRADFALATTLAMSKSADITRRMFPEIMKRPPQVMAQTARTSHHQLCSFPKETLCTQQLASLLAKWNVAVPAPSASVDPRTMTNQDLDKHQEAVDRLLTRHISLRETFWKTFIESGAQQAHVPMLMTFMKSVDEVVNTMDVTNQGLRGRVAALSVETVVAPSSSHVPKSEMTALRSEYTALLTSTKQREDELEAKIKELENELKMTVEVLKANSTRSVRKVVGVSGKEADFARVLYLEMQLEERDKEVDVLKEKLERYQKVAETNRNMYDSYVVQGTETAMRLKVMQEAIVKLNNKVARYDYATKSLEKENEKLKAAAINAKQSRRNPGEDTMSMSDLAAEPTHPDVKRRLLHAARGTSESVPQLLRGAGDLVFIMDLSKEQLDAIVEDLWHHRSVSTSEGGAKFSDFIVEYFKKRYGGGAWREWAYTVYESCKFFEYDINHYLLRLLIQGRVGERVLSEFSFLANVFVSMCERIDEMVNPQTRKHKVHAKHVYKILRQIFPSAPQWYFQLWLEAARQYCCTKENDIIFSMLFPFLGVAGQDSYGRRMSFGVLHQEGPRTVTKDTQFSAFFKEVVVLDNLITNTAFNDALVLQPEASIREVRAMLHDVMEGKITDYQIDVVMATVNGGTMPNAEVIIEMPRFMDTVKEEVVLRRWDLPPKASTDIMGLEGGGGTDNDEMPDWVWWGEHDAEDLDYESIHLLVLDKVSIGHPRRAKKLVS